MHWQSDALTTKLDLIRITKLDLIRITKLDLIRTKLDLIRTKLDLIRLLTLTKNSFFLVQW